MHPRAQSADVESSGGTDEKSALAEEVEEREDYELQTEEDEDDTLDKQEDEERPGTLLK